MLASSVFEILIFEVYAQHVRFRYTTRFFVRERRGECSIHGELGDDSEELSLDGRELEF